jgi:ABC-type glycerol-3-phosphate transport system substrate-binding protein
MGIHVREDGMTTEDLMGYVKQVHAYNQTAETPVPAFLHYGTGGCIANLFYNLLASADMLEDDHESATDRVLGYFEELGKYAPISGMDGFETSAAASKALLEGKGLFFFDATWRYNLLETLDPKGLKKLRLAQMPSFDGKMCVLGGYIPAWAVLKNSPGRDAGIQLLQFWSQPRFAEQWVRNTKNPTGLKGHIYDPSFGEDYFALFQQRQIAKHSQGVLDPMAGLSQFVEQGAEQDEALPWKLKQLLCGGVASHETNAVAEVNAR